MKIRLLLYILFATSALNCFSQNNGVIPGGWRFTTLDGEINLKGRYSERYTQIKDVPNYQKRNYYSAGLFVFTKSYIWHPNFLKMEIGGEFNPESNGDDYMVSPDQSQVRTLKGINIRTTFFDNKPVTFIAWASYNDSYTSRENLSNIKSKILVFGGSIFIKSKFLPINASYNNSKWDQEELQTGRVFKYDQSNFDVFTNKSFSWRDRNKLHYSHNRYYRVDANFSVVNTINDNFRLNNSLFLDKKKKHTFRSMIYSYNRRGTQTFRTFNANETLKFKLAKNFDLAATYNLVNHYRLIEKSRQHRLMGNLTHKLFSSLTTNLVLEYSDTKHTIYQEKWSMIAATVSYTKKIPKGELNLAYTYSFMPRKMVTETAYINVINEEYILADGEITMLHRPYIDINSVVVKDVTGSIIYQRDYDYILIERSVFIEIQRMPGGQIPNNSKVYIDYIAEQTGSYKYNAITNNFYVNVTLFKRILELYYRGRFNDFRNVEKSDLLILNYLKENTFGGKINFKFVEVGAEYQDHNSTISPYKLMRYYLNVQKRLKRFILSLNGNYRDYYMVDEEVIRKYTDITGGATYEFSPNTKLIVTLGYRKQSGPGIDMDLLIASTEFKIVYRKIYITLGANLYRRDLLNDLTNYRGVYAQISRKF